MENDRAPPRDCIAPRAPLPGRAWPAAGHSLADELLRPSVIYAPAVLAVLDAVEVHAVAHITGGGLPGNLPRVLPGDLDAVVAYVERLSAGTPHPGGFSLANIGPVAEGLAGWVFGMGVLLAVARSIGSTT